MVLLRYQRFYSMTKKTHKKMDVDHFSEGYRRGGGSVSDIVESSLNIAREHDGEIHAFLGLYNNIQEEIDKIQKGKNEEKNRELYGVPCAIKDNILYKDQITSAGSKMLESYIAPYSATVVNKLREAGAIIIGRTNMDEFAMGSSTEYSAYGPTKNPVNTEYVPGGSSGGSAAAVAMGAVPFSLGSDTAGSVRQPASFCGVVGLKPSYGSVSRHGLMAMGSSLDVIGPITNTVSDSEKIFNIIRGYDPMDATSVSERVYQDHQKGKEVKKIGIPRSFVESEGVSDDVKNNFNEVLKSLEDRGCEIVDIEIPLLEYALSIYYILSPAEVSSNLARYDGIKYGRHIDGDNLVDTYKLSRAGFGEEVKRRILTGTYVLSAGYADEYYYSAKRAERMIQDQFKEIFKSVDVIATPTTPTEPFKIGEKSDPLSMYMMDIFTVPANIVGVPAISVPSGFGENELPLGIQFMAPLYNEQKLFTVGRFVEEQNR
jgi:aspartyl-tRNA(Asn)/glutamyl-tRNA(Gln) amidotransferase subunit A